MRLVSTLPGAAVRRAKVLPALHTLIRSRSIANAAKIDEPNALDFHFRVGKNSNARPPAWDQGINVICPPCMVKARSFSMSETTH